MDTESKAELLHLAKAEKGISRDIIVPGEMNLHALHYAIQRLFGWQNSHLHKFALSDGDFEKLTDDRFGEYAELCGVLFRFPNDDFSDLYWDDDYKEGSNFKNWIKKKYTAPYRCACVADSWPDNWQKINDFRVNFPQFNDNSSLKSIAEKVDMGEDFNCLMERLTINELLWLQPEDYPENQYWLGDIKRQVAANIKELEDDPEIELQMREASDKLKYWRQVRDWLDMTKYYHPNNYKSTTRKEFGRSYDEMVEECERNIPYLTIECSTLLNAWVVEPTPNFTELYYQYDYGDDWWLKITVEDVCSVNPQEALTQPVCVAADGLDLVGDCGGINGYVFCN